MMKKDLRILYLINSFNSGGAERGILSLIETGFFKDVCVDIVSIHKGTGTLFDELKAKDFKGSVHCVTDDEKLSIKAMLKSFVYVIKAIHHGKHNFLMLSLVQANMVGLTASLFFPYLKVITFAHNSRFSKKIYAQIIRLFSFRINYCLFDDYSSKRAMENLFLKRQRKWLYTPLHAVQLSDVKRTYSCHEPAQILSVGRLNKQKNYPEAIKAVGFLKDKGLNVVLNILGVGEDEEKLKSLVHELGLQEHIRFTGFVKNWVGTSSNYDIFLLSSIYEGMSIVTVEAMGAAMPIVATDVGGVSEYGGHLHNMYVVNTPKAIDIASGIEHLLKDEKLRASIGCQAARDARDQFGADHVQELIRKARLVIFS